MDYEYEGHLSKGQYAIIVIVVAISALVSTLGSFAVTRIAFLKLSSTYQRFLFMLSVVDILNSLFLMIHRFLVPNSPDFYWAFGTDGTCSMAGFVLHFGSLSVAMYNCFLSIYFFFSIQSSPKREKLPEDVIGIWEWIAHLSCFAVPAGIAGAALGTGNIDLDDSFGVCTIHSYDCIDTPNDPDCSDPWPNGNSYPNDMGLFYWIWVGALLAALLASIVATLMVYLKVRSMLSGGQADGSLGDEMKQRLQAVSTQAFLYTFIILNSFFFLYLAYAVQKDGRPLFALQLLSALFFPIQGIFNCFVYIRPRFQMLKMMYPEDSMFVVFRVSMSRAGDPEEIEDVREQIYGDAYEMPSRHSSEFSLASDIPPEVAFDPSKPMSATSLVSAPDDDDDMDPEAKKENLGQNDDDAKSG